MSRPSYEYWDEYAKKGDYDYEKDYDKEKGCDKEKDYDDKKEKGCDCESARALKKIISLLDDLNNKDLRLLDEIIDRILCERKR